MNKNLLYGKNPILEALQSEKPIDKIFIVPGLQRTFLDKIKELSKQRGIPVREVNRGKMTAMTGYENHQGIIAIVPQAEYGTIEEIFNNAHRENSSPAIALLDEIQDPHNLGAIVRSADAFGIHGIIITKNRSVGLTDVVAKTSAGAIHHVTVARVTNLAQTIDELKENGTWIIGTDQNSRQKIDDVDLTMPIGIVIGSEGKGIRHLVKEKCDFLVQIPMYGKINSLNASVAAAIMFWEIRRQRSG